MPEYKLSGKFTGREVSGATKWLKKLERDLRSSADQYGEIPVDLHLESMYFLLTDEAEEWAESDYPIIDAFENPSKNSLNLVVRRLKERFPGRNQKPTVENFRQILDDLGQELAEPLENYYQRAQGQLKQFLGRDPDISPLSSSDQLIRNMMTTSWIGGLINNSVRDEVERQVGDGTSTLTDIYKCADRVERSMKAADRRRSQREAELELEYYRDEVRRGRLRSFTPGMNQNQDQSKSQHHPTGRQRFPFMPPVADPAVEPNRRRREETSETISTNDFVNGIRQYDATTMGVLCIQCGNLGHYSNRCNQLPLSERERGVLRSLVRQSRPVHSQKHQHNIKQQKEGIQEPFVMSPLSQHPTPKPRKW